MSIRDDLEKSGFHTRVNATDITAWRDDGEFFVVDEQTRIIKATKESRKACFTFDIFSPSLIYKGKTIHTWAKCTICREELSRSEREQARDVCLTCEIKFYDK